MTKLDKPIKNQLSVAVVKKIPLLERLEGKEFLESCEDGKTVNVNES